MDRNKKRKGQQLAEVVVTPRGSYTNYTGAESKVPLLSDFFEAKAREARINAANHILQQRSPDVPALPKSWKQDLRSWAAGIFGMSDEERIDRFGSADPETCIYTALSQYNDSGALVSGNKTFQDNYQKYGFEQVPWGKEDVGDLVQFDDGVIIPNPKHATIVTGFDRDSNPVLSYSRGGTDQTGIYYDNDLGYEREMPTMVQDEERGEVIRKLGALPYGYRYVGSDSQKKKWAEEYAEKFNVPYREVDKEVRGLLYSAPGTDDKTGSWAYGGSIQNPQTAWDKLTMRDKADIMRVAINNGIYKLDDIKDRYEELMGDYSPSAPIDSAPVEQYDGEEDNVLKNGGRIYIKPSHRGKFTALKKRTGHSASWFKAHGTPAQKKMATFALNAKKWKHGDGGPLVDTTNGGPKYKKSEQAYYDKDTDTIYAPDSLGEFYHHEMFHARPDSAELVRLKPYYDNLNDNRLLELGADLPFVKRIDNDPGHFYSPEEVGARVKAARHMLNNAGVKKIDNSFLKEARKDENAYGNNFRDLLHMYNDDNLIGIFENSHSLGGPLVDAANAHIYDGTTEDSQQMNDDYIFTGRPSQYDFQVTAEAPTVYWDGFNWIGFNDLGQRVTKGSNFNPSGARIIENPQEFENARLAQARKTDINGTHRFAEKVRGVATLAAMAPVAGPLVEAATTVAPTAMPWVKGAMELGVRPTSTIVRGLSSYIPQVSKAVPYFAGLDKAAMGMAGLFGMKDAYEGWQSGEKHWANALAEGALSGLMLGEMSPAVKNGSKAIKSGVDNIERRAFETAMRTTSSYNPIFDIGRGVKKMWSGDMGGKERMFHIADYILSGRKVGPKGYYNSLADFYSTPEGYYSRAYTGFIPDDFIDRRAVMQAMEKDDLIDAFLYGKDIDNIYGIKKINTGKEFGQHEGYVLRKYPHKANSIPVYEMESPNAIDESRISAMEEWKGANNGYFDGGKGFSLNAAGHRAQKGITYDELPVIRRQDIWKFNPNEYYKKWFKGDTDIPLFKRRFVYKGLKELDRLGTPVISRTKWMLNP